jgi:hypothetical protein
MNHYSLIFEALNILEVKEPITAKEFKVLKDNELIRLFFLNKRGAKGLRLSDTGFNVFNKCFENFSIKFKSEKYVLTGKHRIFLDRFCKAPFHIAEGKITLFDREEAFKIKMIDADIDLLIGMHPHI